MWLWRDCASSEEHPCSQDPLPWGLGGGWKRPAWGWKEVVAPRRHGHEGPQQVPCSTVFLQSLPPCLFRPLSS